MPRLQDIHLDSVFSTLLFPSTIQSSGWPTLISEVGPTLGFFLQALRSNFVPLLSQASLSEELLVATCNVSLQGGPSNNDLHPCPGSRPSLLCMARQIHVFLMPREVDTRPLLHKPGRTFFPLVGVDPLSFTHVFMFCDACIYVLRTLLHCALALE